MAKAHRSVVDQYQGVIRALVPFAARGKLQEGLNKFSSRIPAVYLSEIEYEVTRLAAPCDKNASSRQFAKELTSIVKVGKVKVELDSVGRRILDDELVKYNNLYTHGVYEAITSESRYYAQIAKESRERVEQDYSVDCAVSLNDTLPADPHLVPDFTVHSTEFDDGRPQTIHALSKNKLLIATSFKPPCFLGEKVAFTFPAIANLSIEPMHIEYQYDGVKPLKGRGKYAAKFVLHGFEKWAEKVSRYIQAQLTVCPLVAEQEAQRTKQMLYCDALLSNSASQALLCSEQLDYLRPEYWLSLSLGQPNALLLSLCANAMKQVSQDLEKMSESYQFQFTDIIDNKPVRYVGTLRQLKQDRLLGSFIKYGQENHTLKVLRISAAKNTAPEVKATLAQLTSPISNADKRFSTALFVTDVTHELNGFRVHEPISTHFIAEKYVEKTLLPSPRISIAPYSDRRENERYAMNAKVKVRTHWLKSKQGRVVNISSTGLCLFLDAPPDTLPKRLAVKLDNNAFIGFVYRVVAYNPQTGKVNLHISRKHQKKKQLFFGNFFAKHYDYLSQRETSSADRHLFDYFWAFSSSCLPGVQILIGEGEDIPQRLRFAKTDGKHKSLYPFKMADRQLATHGWLVDDPENSSHSTKLKTILSASDSTDRSWFFAKLSNGKYVNLRQSALSKKAQREKIYQGIKEKSGMMIAHSLISSTYLPLDNYWYQKRCTKLSKVDKLAFNRIKKQESEFIRVLNIVPVTLLHQNILLIGSFSAEPRNQKRNRSSFADAG
ncbi:PilZ domain-containing protein [Aestuariibacter sp. AA17]|uniref:PilZ domain-containing protein n=1 Tax=Fluctibacter corallii TaxID=2984329 RepID=A0ABT3A636_9ALTE|nr:PilZ domain-containing protein [Aestuariibacter sp. AA17]MCV2883816.1 PilZ domain-containing protein [Aestuariibacter sp. AA17]